MSNFIEPTQAQVHRIGQQEENNRLIQALYRATGNRAIFKLDHTLPTTDIVITPQAWATLLQEIYAL